MAEAPTHSLTCPTLIGRVAQRAQLFAQLEQARQGYGQLAVINGEAGVGKSRLVAEVTRQAMAAGMPVTQVRCYAEDHAAPYGPLLALLHHHLSHRPVADLRAALGDGAGELGRLAPALRAGAPPAEDLAGGKRRLWQALQQLVTGLPETGPLVASPSRPLLLLFEDLHWCDEATLEFLIVLARQTPDRPHFLVITYRPDEMTPPLMRFLAAIARDLPAGEYPLSRLNEEEVEAMLCAIFRLARPPQADFREALFRLTGGNPFFIEEVLKACVAEGSIFPLGDQWGRKPLGQLQIPRTVQLAVQQRMAQLTPAAQELLVLAAVAGQRWAFDLLLRTSGQSERALIALVKELIASQLVVEEAPDQFAFRHALTQQAVYAGLLARERRLYHQQIADTLEQMLVATPGAGETATLTEGALARHAAAAGQWARALHYAGRAGEQAQQLQAPRSAVEHYTRALSAVQALGQPPLLALLHARGECYEMLGDFAAAQSDWEAMLDGAAAAGDRRHHWQALLNLGFLWTSRDFGRAAAYYDRALDLARTLADPAALARTLNRIGNWHVNMEDPHLGQRYHQEALQIFEQMGDLPGKAATLDLLAGAAHFGGNLRQGMTWYAEAAALFRQLGDRRAMASSLAWLAFRCPTALNRMVALAPLADCIRSGEEALAVARDVQWLPGSAFAMIGLAFAWNAGGHYAQALALAEQALAITLELEHGWATVASIALGAIWIELGDHATAQRHLTVAKELSARWNIGFGAHNTASFLALSLTQQGRLAEAAATLHAVFGEPSLPAEPAAMAALTLKQRIYWSVRSELALAQGNVAAALQMTETLLIAATHEAATGVAPEAVRPPAAPRLNWLRARALGAAGEWAAAAREVALALPAALALDAAPDCWRLHLLHSEVARAQGRSALAAQEEESARVIIAGLAARLPAVALRERYLAQALACFPQAPALTPRRQAKAQSGGLTEREWEIAQFITQGLSDQAIAERLVSTHVSNILGKLDFSSRSQIAAWVAARNR
jgi:tetratricopeptide (TPR) repeat protein